MAYSAPTPANLKTRYPAFAAVADGTVQAWLDDAATFADDGWPDADRATAVMAYAAHRMAELGLVASAIPAGVTSFKSGTFSATVSDAVAGLTGLKSTAYGREFIALRRRNFAGPRLAWTPPEPE